MANGDDSSVIPQTTNITLPGGFTLSGIPAGTSPAQILAELQRQGYDTKQLGGDPGVVGGLEHGLSQPVIAGLQLVHGALQAMGVPGLNPIPQRTANDELIYQLRRELAAQQQGKQTPGMDVSSMVGEVASPLSWIPATGALKVGQAATKLAPVLNAALPKLLGTAAAGAGLTAATTPVDQPGDFWSQKLGQAESGAIAAPLAALGLGTLARVVKPNVEPAVAAMQQAGIDVTPMQAIGPRSRWLEKGAMALPLAGEAVGIGRQSAIEDFNTATANKVLEPLGRVVPSNIKPGDELMEYVEGQLNDAYDRLIPKTGGSLDPQLQAELSSLRQGSQYMSADQRQRFNDMLDKEVIGKFTDSGLASGETLQGINEFLGKRANASRFSTDPRERELGGALAETQDSIRRMLERQNPMYADALQNTRQAYSRMVVMQDASGQQSAIDGVFTPGHLLNAVRGSTQTLRKRGWRRGDMAQFAQQAQDVLGSATPETMNPYWGIPRYLLGGYYLTHPTHALAEGALAGVYGPSMVRNAVTSFLTGRQGPVPTAISSTLRKAPLYGAPLYSNP